MSIPLIFVGLLIGLLFLNLLRPRKVVVYNMPKPDLDDPNVCPKCGNDYHVDPYDCSACGYPMVNR